MPDLTKPRPPVASWGWLRQSKKRGYWKAAASGQRRKQLKKETRDADD